MKVRNGFVSNSSSSSFLVGIPSECVTFEDYLRDGISAYEGYGEMINPVDNWDTYFDHSITNCECIKQLWDDVLIKNNKVHMEDWIDHIHNGSIPEGTLAEGYTFVSTWCCPHNVANIYRGIYGDENADKIEKRLMKIGSDWNSIVGEALIRDVFDVFDGNVYEICYSDNDGQMNSLMEHGAFWKYIPHVKISYH